MANTHYCRIFQIYKKEFGLAIRSFFILSTHPKIFFKYLKMLTRHEHFLDFLKQNLEIFYYVMGSNFEQNHFFKFLM
jgi:hypothetical protein